MKIPSHLDQDHATGMTEGAMVAQFEIGNYRNFIYLVLDWTTKKAAIIDPQFDLSLPFEALEKYGFELSAVLLTHAHKDHTAGVPEILKTHPGIPVIIHRGELFQLDEKISNQAQLQFIRDGDPISVGSLTLQTIHAPGHTAGECCFLLAPSPEENYLFTGDAIFIRDCGRTDFPTGSNEEMFQTIQRIKKLPKNAIVLPGHHYHETCASLLDTECKKSPPFQCKTVAELVALP